jgi:hypothetical protein
MISFDQGTSYAAPKVAHLAGLIVARYPEASPNLIRALLVQSARLPDGVEGWDRKLTMRLCGYGVPDLVRAIYCQPQRVTYYREGEITPGEVQIYEIPVPKEMHAAKGKKRLSVTVAYDPPVSVHLAQRPAGISLTWDVARGDVSMAEIERAIVAEAEEDEVGEEPKGGKKEPKPFMTGSKLPKRPQSRGTVQKHEYVWERKGEFGDTYRLAVTAKAVRPVYAREVQKYSVVVSLECEDTALDLFALVRTRLQAGRVRVRLTDRKLPE